MLNVKVEQTKKDYLLLKIKSKGKSKKIKMPANLSMVLDHSGSMSDMVVDGVKERNDYSIPQPQPFPWVHPKPYSPFPDPLNPYPLIGGGPNSGGVNVQPLSVGVVGINDLDGHKGWNYNSADQADQIKKILGLHQNKVIEEKVKTVIPKNKITLAIEAMSGIIPKLAEEDILSIVIFDDKITTLVPAQKVGKDMAFWNAKLNSVKPAGYTALFDGWRQGGAEVVKNLNPEHLNRVFLFTDGEANQGVTSPDAICAKVKELSQAGISSSTFGVGKQFNEDLLQKMAMAGDGNYYYIENEKDFAFLIQEEIDSSQNTVATGFKIKLPVGFELMNELSLNNGFYSLPNLRSDKEVEVLLKMPEFKKSKGKKEKFEFNFEFILDGKLETESFVYELQNAKENKEVLEKVNDIKLAQEKKKAVAAFDRGDRAYAKQILTASAAFCNSAMETATIGSLSNMMDDDGGGFRKAALYQSYKTFNSRK